MAKNKPKMKTAEKKTAEETVDSDRLARERENVNYDELGKQLNKLLNVLRDLSCIEELRFVVKGDKREWRLHPRTESTHQLRAQAVKATSPLGMELQSLMGGPDCVWPPNGAHCICH
jgi:hypothetical protein